MVQWPTPTTLKQLRGFLGLTGFYRRFIKNYASLSFPLTELLKKDAFHWNPSAQNSFDSLKEALTKAPILALPDFTKTFVLQTDASGTGIGAVLTQNGHPVSYFSKKLCPKLQNSSTYVRELHAITTAVQKWRHYFLGNQFIIETDQKSLRELMNQVIQTPAQHYYLSKLLGYDYVIVYKPGKSNTVADALSRRDIPTNSQFLLLTTPSFDFLTILLSENNSFPDLQALHSAITKDKEHHSDYSINRGILYYKNKPYLSKNSSLIPLFLQEFHASPTGGHAGVTKTFNRLKDNVYWESMYKDTKDFVSTCLTCQQTKYVPQPPLGLLQPIPPPSGVWEDIAMDFIVSLPANQGHSVILVVIDRFSKAAHFGSLPTHFSAYKTAELFTHMVFKLHGYPKSIISDRDPIFISKFWKTLFQLNGTKLRMSTAYHPQSDGQTEVMNRCLQQYLRSFVHEKPADWVKYLHWAEWSYNTAVHSSTGFTPFEIVYGKPPPNIPLYIHGSTNVEAVDSVLQSRDEILEILKTNLTKAQRKMKLYADQQRTDKSFQVGDWVYLKLKPYRQLSAKAIKDHKLSKRFFWTISDSGKNRFSSLQVGFTSICKDSPSFPYFLIKRTSW